MKAETLAQILLRDHDRRGALTARASRITEAQAPRALVDLIEAAYHWQAFNAEGQALELVDAVIENHAAGVYAEIEFAPRPVGFTLIDLERLTAVDLAALLCLVVCFYLERRYLGAKQILLITRDAEQAIATEAKEKRGRVGRVS